MPTASLVPPDPRTEIVRPESNGLRAIGPLSKVIQGATAPSGRWFDIALASLLLVVTSPLLLSATALVLIVDGRPIFYRGRRMGFNGRPFTILKLRSLRAGAESRVQGDTLGNRHHLKTRTGNFLRETRIDELPQLINVLRGDMALIGPRPEREEVYGAQCADLHGYELRFRVRPGIFSYSQVFTPHSTPKRVRTWIDNSFVQRGNAVHRALTLLALTTFALGSEVTRRVWRFLSESIVRQRLLGHYSEQRQTRRVQRTGARAHLDRRKATSRDRRSAARADFSAIAPADRRQGTHEDRRTQVDPGFEILDANEAALRASGLASFAAGCRRL